MGHILHHEGPGQAVGFDEVLQAFRTIQADISREVSGDFTIMFPVGSPMTGSQELYHSVETRFAGWSFYDLQIGYEYLEDNATISFTPWLGDFYDIKSYAWDFGDGELSNEESPMHLFPSYGDYNVSLVLTLEDNSTLESSKIVSYQKRALRITQGWNLLGVPTKEDIQTDSFPDSFTFFTYAEGQWSVNPTVIEPMQGFWVHADFNVSYGYSGEPYELQSYAIADGWNLLSTGEKVVCSQFQDISVVWRYRDGAWTKNPNDIDVGGGFWMKK